MTGKHLTSTPWYRVPLVWFSVAVVLAAIGGRTAEEYQQDVREQARDRAAAALGLQARLRFSDERREMRIQFNRRLSQLPLRLEVRLRHENRADAEQIMTLTRAPDGSYRTLLPDLADGRWQVRLAAEDWRLLSSWDVPREHDILFTPSAR